ncbi:flavin monoamine oxidase family protein [Halobiforma nitratireducens]|uniref:Amine oxidase n=1 Tax=Halobiforma nitratireducens JCM 10879 TaxID=1227454 RepID=M0M1D0_9EURY|nr:FAD-dependent oxidoreductase [Halobiforma nitratireducens]EMA39481.1 amine oxidase [Halobiforma nitratireducens JCM 10879]
MSDFRDANRYDVGVVGAGLAGLTATRELAEAGLDVVVLEARGRVGGRTVGESLSTGETIDRGAEWIGAEHDRVLALVEEFDLELSEQYGDGLDRVAVAGDLFEHEDRVQALPSESATELREAADRVESLRRDVPFETPRDAPEADTWDATTVESWKRETMETTAAREAFDAFVRAEFTVEPSEMSLLYFLTAVDAAGGLELATDSVSVTQQHRLVGGSQQLSTRLADDLEDVIAIRLNEPVRRIDRRGDDVTLASDDDTYVVSDAIVAVPPPLVERIDHEPPLPARRRGLGQRMPMGAVIKFVAAYESPFWRADGYSGSVLAADGIVAEVADGTRPNTDRGHLVGFVAGADAFEWSDRPLAERRERVLDDLERYFGTQAATPLEYVDEAWSKTQWSSGGYNAVMTPGTLTSCGDALREPVEGVHWAGSETALEGRGFMEGAIRSGERAASAVLDDAREQ